MHIVGKMRLLVIFSDRVHNLHVLTVVIAQRLFIQSFAFYCFAQNGLYLLSAFRKLDQKFGIEAVLLPDFDAWLLKRDFILSLHEGGDLRKRLLAFFENAEEELFAGTRVFLHFVMCELGIL